MSDRDDRFNEAFSDLANALQSASPLTSKLRRGLADQVQDAVTLEAAIDRAVRAVHRMRRPEDTDKGGAR